MQGKGVKRLGVRGLSSVENQMEQQRRRAMKTGIRP